jgi:hypothetical protein
MIHLITENLSTLKIHKLTQAQYERELEAGRIDPNALYLTPDGGGNSTIDLTGYATEEWVQDEFQPKGEYLTEVPAGYAKTEDIPTKMSQLDNDAGYLKKWIETDPTVPAWAKESSKPSYSKSEVGLGNVDNVKQYSASNPPPYPVTSVNGKTGAVVVDVPTKVSQLTNDSGYLTQH